MIFRDTLLNRTRQAGNIVCVGLDPLIEKIPSAGPPEESLRRFYGGMLEAMLKRGVLPAAVKPNIAYFEALGLPCLQALQSLIADFRAAGVLVVLDAKRGDIASTSTAYARMAFDVYAADAVTAAPYMGFDSIRPFQEHGQGRGVYVLVRTSNAGARDFQNLMVQNDSGAATPLYLKVAEKLAEWNDGNLGAVVGATAPRELEQLMIFWLSLGKEMPMLIPGISVGGIGQGGAAGDILNAMRNAGGNPFLHLVNSSSGINYAYEKRPSMAPGEASALALEELIGEMKL